MGLNLFCFDFIRIIQFMVLSMKKVESKRHLQEYDYCKSWNVSKVRKAMREGIYKQKVDSCTNSLKRYKYNMKKYIF